MRRPERVVIFIRLGSKGRRRFAIIEMGENALLRNI